MPGEFYASGLLTALSTKLLLCRMGSLQHANLSIAYKARFRHFQLHLRHRRGRDSVRNILSFYCSFVFITQYLLTLPCALHCIHGIDHRSFNRARQLTGVRMRCQHCFVSVVPVTTHVLADFLRRRRCWHTDVSAYVQLLVFAIALVMSQKFRALSPVNSLLEIELPLINLC